MEALGLKMDIDIYDIQGGFHFADLIDDDDEILVSSGSAHKNAYDEEEALKLLLQVVKEKAPELAWFVEARCSALAPCS